MLKFLQKKKKLTYIYVTLKKMSIVEKGISLLPFVIYFIHFFFLVLNYYDDLTKLFLVLSIF